MVTSGGVGIAPKFVMGNNRIILLHFIRLSQKLQA